MTCRVSLASGKRAKLVRAQPKSAAGKDVAHVVCAEDLVSMFTMLIAPRLLAAGTRGETRAWLHPPSRCASDKVRQGCADGLMSLYFASDAGLGSNASRCHMAPPPPCGPVDCADCWSPQGGERRATRISPRLLRTRSTRPLRIALPATPFLHIDLRCPRVTPGLQDLPALKAFRESEAALRALRASNSTTHGIIAAHGISEDPERYRSLRTSAPSAAATRRASGRAGAKQRRTQTRNRLGRVPSGILEQHRRPLWSIGSEEFSRSERLS